eukprot:1162027-Pelagomonas_calceolata.AAC.3
MSNLWARTNTSLKSSEILSVRTSSPVKACVLCCAVLSFTKTACCAKLSCCDSSELSICPGKLYKSYLPHEDATIALGKGNSRIDNVDFSARQRLRAGLASVPAFEKTF